ncbi:hypothetical protein CCMSSC00406_0007582 [Pleurotus cornucopiae]|uniref:Uncharacterized protein n=1 Tax=Pleurotus cornucopiae TaxID=5321 RepID=A0ACB7J023_PLECO|nr:hypothetical protein CCMSSC00406_0007582 [Pleurotus cornucopiae]
MLHSFVVARLLPRLPTWTPCGQKVASSIITKPFLALHLRETDPDYFRMPNLFPISRQRPSLPWSEYFILNSTSEANVRALTVVPPLPFQDPLYLCVTPRICATFDKDEEQCSKLLNTEDYQLDETSAKIFLEALKRAGPSVPAVRTTGGNDEPGDRWDTWSGQSPRETPGILFAGRDVQFDFEVLPLKHLPRQFDTTVFDELPLIRQLILDYTWKTCNTAILYIQSVREAMPRLLSSGRIFRQPRLSCIEDPSPDPLIESLRPSTADLQALPVLHDGDPNPKAVPETDDGEWDDEPSLELDMATATPAVISHDSKVILIDPYILIDRDGPLRTALTHIFPPSQYSFSAKELLDLYVEYETLRRSEGQPDSAINTVRSIVQYFGSSVDDTTISDALESYGKPTHYPDGQRLISELVEHGYTLVAIPSAAKEAIPQYEGLSLGLYSPSPSPPSQHSLLELWAYTLPFCKQFNPEIRADQILVVSSNLYGVCEPASKAGFPTAFIKVESTRSAKLDIPTIASTYTLGSIHDLLPTLRDPSTSTMPEEPEVSYDNPPFRLKDNYQCTFLLGSGSFAYVWNGVHLHTGAGVALKFEVIDPSVPSSLPYEAAVYAQLKGVEGIPRIHWFGQDKNANVLVMDKLGLNLEHLRRFCRGQFGLKTILMLGEQMLSTIELVHARGVIVRDIKPENFAMGYLEDYQRLFLFDMGLSKLYLDPSTGEHMPFREGRGGIGTPRYASSNVHFGLEPSRRDDVEAIGMLLLYLFRGRLPWQGICAPDISAKLRRIGEMKRGEHFRELVAHSPACFAPFFAHCRALEFEEKPDYGLLRKLLGEEMEAGGWEYDWKYDWWQPGERGTLLPDEYIVHPRFVEPVRRALYSW